MTEQVFFRCEKSKLSKHEASSIELVARGIERDDPKVMPKKTMEVDEVVGVLMLVSMSLSGLALFFGQRAPYGRYNNEKALGISWGPKINAQIAWIIQESPSLLVPLLMMRKEIPLGANRVLLAMFLGHYVNRAIIFPLRIRNGKPSPVGVVLAAFSFCTMNGYLQASHLLRDQYPPQWMSTASFRLGSFLFYIGAYLNISADTTLRALRGPHQSYAIPRGGLFEYVSAANYSAELLEWFGFSLATGFSFSALVFFLCTFLNLAPRARSHHQWYRLKFKDEYPAHRCALIPFIF